MKLHIELLKPSLLSFWESEPAGQEAWQPEAAQPSGQTEWPGALVFRPLALKSVSPLAIKVTC